MGLCSVRITRRALALGISGAAAFTTASFAAAATGAEDPVNTPAALVEDYSYPGATQILAEDGIELISGNGNIIYHDCSAPPTGNIGVVKVRTTEGIGMDRDGLVCFKVIATPGQLTLKIPAVYEIRGDGLEPGTGHRLQADLTTPSGDHTTVNVDPDGSTPVGIGDSPDNEPTTLLQLQTSP